MCSWYKSVILYEDNEYLLMCNFEERLMVDRDGWGCTRSTPRDDGTNGAYTMWGSTDGWSCSGKWVAYFLHYLFCMANDAIFFRWKFSSLENNEDPPWRMTSQTEHTTQGSTDGRRSKPTTPRIGILWRMMQQTEHTVYSAAFHQ